MIQIKTLPLSFLSAKELRGRAEMLPSGPRWMSQIIPTKYPTKLPVVLYWRDPLDCISSLLNHPAFHDQLDFTPRRVYTTAQRLCRVYSEWATGDDAWNMQVRILSFMQVVILISFRTVSPTKRCNTPRDHLII